jgi:hypothetical protein
MTSNGGETITVAAAPNLLGWVRFDPRIAGRMGLVFRVYARCAFPILMSCMPCAEPNDEPANHIAPISGNRSGRWCTAIRLSIIPSMQKHLALIC